MKKIITVIVMVLCTLTVFAQKYVTTFLGIPVDGTKSEMKRKLIAKGFTPRNGKDYLTGEFNGESVELHIVTNNNKVYRIMIADINTRNEADIKIRFNNLVKQFEKNQRYITLKDYTISEDDDISFEMSVHSKVYEASYYQKPAIEKIDTVALREKFQRELGDKIPQGMSYQDADEKTKKEMISSFLSLGFDILDKKFVWFRIIQQYGKYYIAMFYDNEYNHADGEDL